MLSVGMYATNALAIDTVRDLRGVEVANKTINWEWGKVDGAREYEVTVDGKVAGKTSSPKWESADLWIGNHSLTVKAIDSSGNKSVQSDTLKVRVTGLVGPDVGGRELPDSSSSSDTLSVVRGLEGRELADRDVLWSWDAVSGAEQYEVTVDGKVAGKTRSTEWLSRDLWKGSHSLTVKAVSSSGKKSVQSETLKIRVTGFGSGSSDVSPPPEQNDTEEEVSTPEIVTLPIDPNAASIKSLIDPASFNYSEVSNKDGYELVFSDEFNGGDVNPYRWHTQLRWDGEWNGERYEYRVVNGEDQFYVNVLSPDKEHQKDVVPVYNPFKFNGKTLSIRAKINPKKSKDKTRNHGKLDDMFAQQQFLSGVLSTHEKFSQKYGYFEARIKIPSHEGTFPAFWLFHERRAWEGTRRTEIDIMENLGHAPQYIYNSFHYFTNVTATYGGDANFIKPKPSGQVYTGVDYSKDFHVYAVEWKPGKVTWFIDGEKVSELYNENVDYEELYLMVNLALGGNWTNFPKNAGGLGRPSDQRWPTSKDVRDFKNPELEIDYVRVYKRK